MRKTVVNSSQAGVEGKCGKCAMRHLLISGYIITTNQNKLVYT